MIEKIEAIIFDIGNVLIGVDIDRCPRQWARLTGMDTEELRKVFWADSHYQPLERGEITLKQYHESFQERLPGKLGFENFRRGWLDIFTGIVDGMPQLLADLAGRVRMVCLSNTNEAHTEDFLNNYPDLFTDIERGFYSHEMKMRKPDTEIYKPVLDYLKIEPQKVLFVDDKLDNVQAAQSLGMQGLHFTDSASLRNYLKL